MQNAARLVISAAVSALVLGLLISLSSMLGTDAPAEGVISGLRSALPAFVAIYAVCQLLQTSARAQRSRVLLRAALGPKRVPGFFRTALVTLVRGACADMLPARLGELSYVAMLNRGCDVPAADCLSSLSIGLLFDFFALLAVLAAAIPAAAQGMSLVGSVVVLAVVCVVGSIGVFGVLPTVAAWRWESLAVFRLRPAAAILALARNVAKSVVEVRHGKVALRVLALSIAVRVAKYAGLWCLFAAITRPLWPELSHAPIPAVLVALIAAEGAASLPVPTFLSFGSYEAGGLAALVALGFPAGDSLVAMTAMHIMSQIIDYSLGGLSFLVFVWTSPRRASAAGSAPAATAQSASAAMPRRRRSALKLALALILLAAALLFDAWQLRSAKKRGRLSPPPAGEESAATADEIALRNAALRAFGGKIVWSSNRSGSHDIWTLDSSSAEPRRLTSSGFTDTFPRFSPDGSRIVFSRSTEPWVSQRNFEKWDTYTLDLATGEEWLVATNAYQACWSGPDSVVFVRAGGTALVRASADGGSEETLLASGTPPLGEGALVTLPDARADRGEILLTLRGAHRATALFDIAAGTIADVADGCQMVWRAPGIPGSSEVAWISHGGIKKNAVFTLPEAAANAADGKALLLDAESPWSHEYFPRFDAEGRYLVYGASTGGHEQDSEDYEIFLYDTSTPEVPPVRLTFHGGNDSWPDITRASR